MAQVRISHAHAHAHAHAITVDCGYILEAETATTKQEDDRRFIESIELVIKMIDRLDRFDRIFTEE